MVHSAAGEESRTCNGRPRQAPHAANITVSTPAPSRKCDMAALCGSSYFRTSWTETNPQNSWLKSRLSLARGGAAEAQHLDLGGHNLGSPDGGNNQRHRVDDDDGVFGNEMQPFFHRFAHSAPARRPLEKPNGRPPIPSAGSMVVGALLQFPEHLVVVLCHRTSNTRCSVRTCARQTTNRLAVWLGNQLRRASSMAIAPGRILSGSTQPSLLSASGLDHTKTIGYFATT